MSAVARVLEVDLGPSARAGFTTAPDNLGLGLGEPDGAVAARRERLAAWAGAPVVWVRQVHGARVHRVTGRAPGPDVEPAEADAVVSDRDDVALAVVVADCVPVLLADPAGRAVGVVHAGRRGVETGVVGAAVAALAGLGPDPAELLAVVGPAACGRCYEVPEELAAALERIEPGVQGRTSWGTPAVDLPGAVGRQLERAGVRRVERLGLCTLEDDRFFSHRGATGGSRPPGAPGDRPPGRFAAVVRCVR